MNIKYNVLTDDHTSVNNIRIKHKKQVELKDEEAVKNVIAMGVAKKGRMSVWDSLNLAADVADFVARIEVRKLCRGGTDKYCFDTCEDRKLSITFYDCVYSLGGTRGTAHIEIMGASKRMWSFFRQNQKYVTNRRIWTDRWSVREVLPFRCARCLTPKSRRYPCGQYVSKGCYEVHMYNVFSKVINIPMWEVMFKSHVAAAEIIKKYINKKLVIKDYVD